MKKASPGGLEATKNFSQKRLRIWVDPGRLVRTTFVSEPRRGQHARENRHRLWLDHSRKTRAGSVRVARHPGNRHAATVVAIITANAAPNARGSWGLTL
jgi:hypothetical protein